MQDLGWKKVGETIDVQWNTVDGAGASVTRATNGSIRIYKDNSTTQRSSSNGITDTEDFDSLTGIHHLRIDLSDNTDAGFYADGSTYHVVLQGAVIDGETVNATLFRFRIGTQPANATQWNSSNVASPATAGYPVVTLKVGTGTGEVNLASGRAPADVTHWDGSAVATPTIAGVPEVDVTHIRGSNGSAASLTVFLSTLDGISAALTEASFTAGAIAAIQNGLSTHSANDVRDAILNRILAGNHDTADSLGKVLQDILGDTNELQTDWVNGGRLDLLIDAIKTKTDNLPASPAAVGSAMTLADDAITSAKFDESTAFPLKAADSGATYIFRTGADGDTGETLSDQIDGISSIGNGPGPFAVVVNVKSGGVNVQSATVRATNGSESYSAATNSSGNATFALPADTWDFYVYKANYLQDDPPLEVAVTADSTSGNNVTLTYDPPGQELTEEDPTMTATYLTSYDLVCHLRDVIGGDDGEERNRSFKRAVSAVHLDYFGEDGWKESLLTSRIEVQAAYSTGTIAFDLTGGSSERLITLSDGTFPSWAGRGSLIIDDEIYRVTSRLGNTTLQLDETFCPTADIASGTAYILFQDSYLLPADCAAIYEPVDKNAWSRHYIDEEEWLRLTTEARFSGDYRFTIMHDDRLPGRFAARFFGYAEEARSLSFLYKRVRKTPVLSGTEANSYVGTIAYTNGSATITGTNTAFSDRMVGSVLRIGDASDVPTDLDGDAPYQEEHVIGAVASATSLTLKTAVGLTTASSIKYRVSDPVSFDRSNHLALKKGAEAHYWLLVKPDSDQRRSSWQVYQDMKMRAHEQQSRHRSTWSPISGSRRGTGRPSVNVNAPS